MVGILSLLYARSIAAFWSFLVPHFDVGALLLFFVIVGPNIPLAQLFLQVVVLLSKAFHHAARVCTCLSRVVVRGSSLLLLVAIE